MLHGLKQRWPLLFLIFAWGMLEGISLFGLGGTFMGLIPGNLILSIADLGQHPLTPASAARAMLPVVTMLLGMAAAGVCASGQSVCQQSDDGFWLALIMFFVLALLLATLPANPVASMQVFVVSLSALVLGFQVGLLYSHKYANSTVRVPKLARLLGASLSYPINVVSAVSSVQVGLAFLAFVAGLWFSHGLVVHTKGGVYWIAVLLMAPATIYFFKRQRAK